MARVHLPRLSASTATLAVAVSLAALAFVIVAPACNEVKVLPAADAGVNCGAPQLIFGCVVQAAGTPGCSPDVNSGVCLGRTVDLDASATYGATLPDGGGGCQVIVNNPTPDEDLQCSQDGICSCTADGDGGYYWLCTPCLSTITDQ
jgi:hypothetical protein